MSTVSTTTYVADRQASFDRLFNFRDLGGYLAAGGRTVRWGRLYRSDSLHQVSDNDVATLQGLGLRTVVDLRTADEVAERGSFPSDRYSVAYHHLPLMRRTWEDDERLPIPMDDEAAEFLVDRYLEMLDEGGPAFVATVDALARPDAYPAVIHCAVGKDRTGVIAAMLLSLIGVGDDLIVHDYTLSALGMARIEEWLAANSADGAAQWARQPTAWLASPPAAMAGFLAAIRGEYGSCEQYLLDQGVDPSALDWVRANLLR